VLQLVHLAAAFLAVANLLIVAGTKPSKNKHGNHFLERIKWVAVVSFVGL